MDSRYALFDAVKQRLADEHGTLFKEAQLRVALAYPSPYHVGMSSLGFQTIYRELHRHPLASAERVFLPDDVAAYRQQNLPVFSYERQKPFSSFDVLAFSVAYELELTGIFELLTLAGFSPFREQRSTSAPLVVAGGPLTFSNPEPLEPFVDVLVQGEADVLIHELVDVAAELRDKVRIREHLAKRPGFRVPGLADDSSRFYVHKTPDPQLPAYSQILTPHTELRSMFLIEPERGCSRGCHYCVMRRTTNGGMRTVPMAQVLERVPAHARRVGLVGAAVTDHPHIADIIGTLVSQGREVGISSLRADRLTPKLVEGLRGGGAQSLTVASDGASQRLRDWVDRKHSEAQIIRAAELAKAAGMKRLKVYNMVGLPNEEEQDIDELARFTRELGRILPVALGVAPFAAKRNTPLDGSPFAGISVIEQRLNRLRRALKGAAEVRPTSARWAWVEYMLAQCGPEAGLAAHTAWEQGASFRAWEKAFTTHQCQPYVARRTVDGRRNAVVWPSLPPRSAAT
ncbi:MAG: B12-binding domain-containing radical SAM protein [Myxococcaceae bacterium]|nr:B12-binding domain-containing radical SAM protein [Myxococcaceae bacterium]